MEIEFLIDKNKTDGSADIPKLGILEGYIQEGINQMTLIELVLVSDWELDEDACEDFVGKHASISLGGVIDEELLWSRFDGTIFEFSVLDENQVDPEVFAYRLVMRPPFWKLNFTTSYRSFSGASRIDVIDEVLDLHGIKKSVNYDASYFSESKDFPALKQIVQNETTDLQFLQQLMSEGGINFFFAAPKDGAEPEKMMLADHNAFFKKVWTKDIKWIPRTGMTAAERITSFETHHHTMPASVKAVADMGDGMVRTFTGTDDVPDGKGGTHVLFGREGEDNKVPAHKSRAIKEGFAAAKVTYEGHSNHLAIRSGEKVKVKGDSLAKEKDILLVSVRHSFSQSVPAAMSNNVELKYDNVFSAVRIDAPIRPPRIGATPLLNLAGSHRDKSPRRYWDKLTHRLQQELDAPFDLNMGEFPYFDLQQTFLAMLERLTLSSSLRGIWVGEVTESARVTEGNELVCQVANEQFPLTDKGGGLTAKVALGWLTNQGWLSVLPRKGNYVYFIFMQGEGGQNEAVVIGYRPTAAVKTLNPAKTQKTPKLKVGEAPILGETAESVVGKDEYEPSNRYRNTLRSEEGVSEVAVIDGGDDAVAIHANKGIHMVADQEIHVDAPLQCQNANELHQQFVNVNRGVKEDQKESIGKNHEMTVMGTQDIFVGETFHQHVEKAIGIDNNGDDDITIANGEDNTLILHKGEQAILKADDNNAVSIKNNGTITAVAGGAVTIDAGGHTVITNKDGISLTAGSNSVTISKSGSIEVTATGAVTVSGAQVEIKGKATVAISGNAEVSVKGGAINLN